MTATSPKKNWFFINFLLSAFVFIGFLYFFIGFIGDIAQKRKDALVQSTSEVAGMAITAPADQHVKVFGISNAFITERFDVDKPQNTGYTALIFSSGNGLFRTERHPLIMEKPSYAYVVNPLIVDGKPLGKYAALCMVFDDAETQCQLGIAESHKPNYLIYDSFTFAEATAAE